MLQLYSYTLSMPLTYFTYNIRSEESEFVLGLASAVEWDEPYTIEVPYPLDDNRLFKATESIHFCLSSKFTENVSDDGKSSYYMPDKFFMCTISGIVAQSKSEARELVDAKILRACKALSVLMSCHNCNKHGYQPRVEPDYKKQEWKREKYAPYEKLVEEASKPQEYIDESGRHVISIRAENTIHIGESVHMTIFGKVDSTHFFDLYHYEKYADLSYILDEYYTALGMESITSKFFHLFSIIEYVEKSFVHLADSQKVFDENDKQQVVECMGQLNMSKEKLERLRSSVLGAMSKATNLGREAKLVNILHNMDIKEFTECGTQFVVNKESVAELTVLRNSFFHGDGDKVDKTQKHITVDVAVARLMYICEKIILYVMNQKN